MLSLGAHSIYDQQAKFRWNLGVNVEISQELTCCLEHKHQVVIRFTQPCSPELLFVFHCREPAPRFAQCQITLQHWHLRCCQYWIILCCSFLRSQPVRSFDGSAQKIAQLSG